MYIPGYWKWYLYTTMSTRINNHRHFRHRSRLVVASASWPFIKCVNSIFSFHLRLERSKGYYYYMQTYTILLLCFHSSCSLRLAQFNQGCEVMAGNSYISVIYVFTVRLLFVNHLLCCRVCYLFTLFSTVVKDNAVRPSGTQKQLYAS